MPLILRNCVLDSQLGNGATHYALLNDQATYGNGSTTEDVSASVTGISLIGTPGAVAGPYEIKGDFSLDRKRLVVEGPTFGTYPCIPGHWTLVITTSPRDGDDDTPSEKITLKLGRWGRLDSELLNHFEQAWSKLRDHLRENTKAVEEVLEEIQNAKAQHVVSPDGAHVVSPNGGHDNGDSDRDWDDSD